MTVALIGMPGVGKSTVGAALAQLLHLSFVDADIAFWQRYSQTPADCLNTQGEPSFRQKERTVLLSLLQGQHCVIACGGGVVTLPENIADLRTHATVVYLMRPIDSLSSEGRPLSQAQGASALYQKRKPLYERAAHLQIALPHRADSADDREPLPLCGAKKIAHALFSYYDKEGIAYDRSILLP